MNFLKVNKIVYFCSMQKINILKGIHPGIFLANELKKKKLPKVKFAIGIGEHPQTLVSITKGNRSMNTALSLKIEKELALDEGFLMTLQLFYDINKIKTPNKKAISPDLKKIRKELFWDTDIKKIDWHKQKKAVLKRVLERGTNQEKIEINKFYYSLSNEIKN